MISYLKTTARDDSTEARRSRKTKIQDEIAANRARARKSIPLRRCGGPGRIRTCDLPPAAPLHRVGGRASRRVKRRPAILRRRWRRVATPSINDPVSSAPRGWQVVQKTAARPRKRLAMRASENGPGNRWRQCWRHATRSAVVDRKPKIFRRPPKVGRSLVRCILPCPARRRREPPIWRKRLQAGDWLYS